MAVDLRSLKSTNNGNEGLVSTGRSMIYAAENTGGLKLHRNDDINTSMDTQINL